MDEIACHDHDILPLRKACTNGRHDGAFARHSKQKSKVLGAGCSLFPWLDPFLLTLIIILIRLSLTRRVN